MREHYTRNTVSVAAWCARCQQQTQHRVDAPRLGPCLSCIARLDQEHADRGADKEIAGSLSLFPDEVPA